MDVPKVPSGAEVPLELAVEHDGVEELCGEALEGVAHAAAATPHNVLKALLEHVCMKIITKTVDVMTHGGALLTNLISVGLHEVISRAHAH